jgi:hypothetical protein
VAAQEIGAVDGGWNARENVAEMNCPDLPARLVRPPLFYITELRRILFLTTNNDASGYAENRSKAANALLLKVLGSLRD